MDCIKYLNSYDEVAAVVAHVQSRRIYYQGFWENYRGQGRPEYKLLPSIARNVKTPNEVKAKEEKLISSLLRKLKKAGLLNVLRIDDTLNADQNIWNIQFQAQHLGIETRFLDWSLSWKVGLWFAVENPKNDDVDGQFWVFTVPDEIGLSDSENNYYQKDLKNLDKTYFVSAPIYWSDELKNQVGEIKRQRQFGKFSVSPFEKSIIPLEEQPELKGLLEKFCIPSAIKGQLRLELASNGIHEEWLYYRENQNDALDKFLSNF
jgi:hypothetical protein